MRARPLAFVFSLLFVFVAHSQAQSAPSISSLSQSLGAGGMPITISGANFGASQGSSLVTFGSVAASVSSWSDTSITAAVPSSLVAGNLNIVVTVSGVPSNAASFLVIPVITGLSTYSAAATQTYFVDRGQVRVFWPSANFDSQGFPINTWFGAFTQTATVSPSDPRGATFRQVNPDLQHGFACQPGPAGQRGCDAIGP